MSLLVLLGTALVWCLIIGSFTARQVFFGALLGVVYVVVGRTWRRRSLPIAHLPRRLAYFAIYALILIPYDIIQSNLDLARRLLRRTPDINPGIIRMYVGDIPRAASALVAHSLTMTPGEIVLDYSDDGDTMYIHLIDVGTATSRRAGFWDTYHNVLKRVFS